MQTVEITIAGGAVQSISCPPGIRVLIRDYDVDDVSEDDGFDIRTDEEGDRFQFIEFARKAAAPSRKADAKPKREPKPKRRS